MKTKLHTSQKWLTRQWVTLGLDEDQIAAKAGVDRATINRWLHKFKLKRER